jgi:hypothetical protein
MWRILFVSVEERKETYISFSHMWVSPVCPVSNDDKMVNKVYPSLTYATLRVLRACQAERDNIQAYLPNGFQLESIPNSYDSIVSRRPEVSKRKQT